MPICHKAIVQVYTELFEFDGESLSNPFLKPTSVKQWGFCFLDKETWGEPLKFNGV